MLWEVCNKKWKHGEEGHFIGIQAKHQTWNQTVTPIKDKEFSTVSVENDKHQQINASKTHPTVALSKTDKKAHLIQACLKAEKWCVDQNEKKAKIPVTEK